MVTYKTTLEMMQARYGAENVKEDRPGVYSVRDPVSGIYRLEYHGTTREAEGVLPTGAFGKIPAETLRQREFEQTRLREEFTYRQAAGVVGTRSIAEDQRMRQQIVEKSEKAKEQRVQDITPLFPIGYNPMTEASKEPERQSLQERRDAVIAGVKETKVQDISPLWPAGPVGYSPISQAQNTFEARQAAKTYTPVISGKLPAQPGSIAAQYESARTIQEAGYFRTTGAILSSSELFAKGVETGLRGIGEKAGLKDTGYSQSTQELIEMTADRLKNKPTPTQLFLESPITAAIPIGAGAKVGSYVLRSGLIKGAGAVGKYSPTASRVLSISEKVIEPGVTVVGAGIIGYDVAKSKDVYEAGGKLASYGAMTPGAMFGWTGASKAISRIQTLGMPKAPSPILPEVLSGKDTFPTTRAGSFEKFKKEFIAPGGELKGYHTTPTALPKESFPVHGTTPERALDVPGMYISPFQKGASPVFLRIQGAGSYSLRALKSSSPLKPEISLIGKITDIRRIPGGRNVQKAREFLSSQSQKATKSNMERMVQPLLVQRHILPRGAVSSSPMVQKVPKVDALTSAYIEPKMEMGGFRGEAQAVLAPGTMISAPKTTFRVSVKGYSIPLVEREIVGTAPVKATVEPQVQKPSRYFRTRQYYEPEYAVRVPPALTSRTSQTTSRATPISSRVIQGSRAIQSSIRKSVSSRVMPSSKAPVSSKTSVSSRYAIASSRIAPSSRISPESRVMLASRPFESVYSKPVYRQPPIKQQYKSRSSEILLIRRRYRGTTYRPYVERARIATPRQVFGGIKKPRSAARGKSPAEDMLKKLRKKLKGR